MERSEKPNNEVILQRLRGHFFGSRLTRPTLFPPILVLIETLSFLTFSWLAPSGTDGNPHPSALLLAGANDPTLVFAGDWWRMIAPIFLHVSPSHLIVNAIGLYFLAQFLENTMGRAAVWLVFIVGGTSSFAVSTIAGGDPSVGASGAVFALLGALGGWWSLNRRRLPPTGRKSLSWLVVLWLLLSIFHTLHSPEVDHAAHAGGLVAGVLLAILLGRRVPFFDEEPRPTSIPVMVAVVVTLLTAVLAIGFATRNLMLDFSLPDAPLTPMHMDGIMIPVPSTWQKGLMWEDRCHFDDRSLDELAREGTVCFREPYGGVLLIGPAERLAPGTRIDPSMTAQYGLNSPIEQNAGDVTQSFLLLNREHALAFLGFAILAPKYSKLLNEIAEGIRFEEEPQRRPTP